MTVTVIAQLKQFFKTNLTLDAGRSVPANEHTHQLTTAALLIEVSRADFELNDVEKDSIIKALSNTFALNTVDLDTLITMAEEQVQHSTSLYQLTRLVNDFYSYDEKLALISSMWQVAFADDNLDRYETHLIRKVANLTYVTHADFIRLKHTVSAHQASM